MLGFGFNFANSGTSSDADICIVVMGTSGDWRGHIAGSGSIITPNASMGGLDLYEYKWNIVTGEFVISWGDTGDDEVDNLRYMLIAHPKVPDKNETTWFTTTTDYRFTDLELAQYIDDDVDRACFHVELMPVIAIIFDFSVINTGTRG